MNDRPAQRAPFLALLAIGLSCFAAFADTAPAAATAAMPADLKDARARLAKASSPAEYAAMLDSFATALPPSDALALLDQGIAQAAPERRRALIVKAADLDLLVGLFGDAASRYEAAADMPAAGSQAVGGRDLGLLLRAARCSIAAGDYDKAQALSAEVAATAPEGDLSASARLVGAWVSAMQGRRAEASSTASAIAGAAKTGAVSMPAERRREARFLIWLCTESADKAAAAASLASEFPGSPEALIAAGSASAPPLPHWYLGGLRTGLGASEPLKKPGVPAPAAAPAVSAASPAQASAPAARGKRLQVGYFSREDNAQALKDELSSKGFAPLVEPRMRAAGAGKGEEKRWIVAVDGGKDIAKTMQSLKDAGYESYIIE
jgi:cell division septation protein DedD